MKKYMAYSFGTLWTLVLIVALVAAIINQIKFQGSPSELKLNIQLQILEIQKTKLEISLHATKQEYSSYRRTVEGYVW
jgi:hypothetical protein